MGNLLRHHLPDTGGQLESASRQTTYSHYSPSGRVIYIGSFTHSMFSSLRVGYMVVPPSLVDPFCGARSISDWSSPTVTQAILADFIGEGYFASHLRRMRLVYEARRNALTESVDAELDGGLELSQTEAGIQLIGWLPDGLDDNAVSRAAVVLLLPRSNTPARRFVPGVWRHHARSDACQRPAASRGHPLGTKPRAKPNRLTVVVIDHYRAGLEEAACR